MFGYLPKTQTPLECCFPTYFTASMQLEMQRQHGQRQDIKHALTIHFLKNLFRVLETRQRLFSNVANIGCVPGTGHTTNEGRTVYLLGFVCF